MVIRAINQDEKQALERLIVYVRDDCGELRDYYAMKKSGEDVSLHIWEQVGPLIGYLHELKKRDCPDCGRHEKLYACERCHQKHCDRCLTFVEWFYGRPYLCRRCLEKAVREKA